jgi:hypothetical protein
MRSPVRGVSAAPPGALHDTVLVAVDNPHGLSAPDLMNMMIALQVPCRMSSPYPSGPLKAFGRAGILCLTNSRGKPTPEGLTTWPIASTKCPGRRVKQTLLLFSRACQMTS